jgi:hypothetical protein
MAGRDIAATTPASAVERKTLPELTTTTTTTTPTSTPTTNTSAWVINSSLWKRRQLRPIYQPPPSYARSPLPASTTKATHLNNSLISSWGVANNSTDIPKYVTAEPDNPWFKQDKLNQFKANCTPPPPPPPPQHQKNPHNEEETTSFAADCSSQDPALPPPPPLPTSPLPSKKISKSKFQV